MQFILVAAAGVFLISVGSHRISGRYRKARRRGGFYRWLARKLGLPSPEARRKLLRDWDYAQIDDWKVLSADPNKDSAIAAASLHASAPEEAFHALLGLAEEGSVWSMLWVAWCYHTGQGVLSDMAQSEAWFRRAFEGGSERGLLEYGKLQWSRGDLEKCEATFSVGAANGWAPAQYWLARVRVRKSRTRATLREVRSLLENAIAKGSPAAKSFLGYFLGRGEYGLRAIPSGFKLAWQFVTETRAVLDAINASEKGSASAQYRLGWIYAFGGSIAHNDLQAVELFSLSAAQGNANAMLAKGWMHAHGRGVAYDPLQTYVWTGLAAIRLREKDVESRNMAIEYRDWARSHLSKAEAAKARRMVKNEDHRIAEPNSAMS